MGTDEVAMAWIKDEIARVVGLPREVGGIPLDEIGSTGFGLTIAAQVAEKFSGVKLKGARLAVQGFGAVGRDAARFLAAKGATLVAASDTRGAVADPQGLDIEALCALKAAHKSVVDLKGGKRIEGDDLIGVDCDIWIPAARPDVVHAGNVDRLKTKLMLQGANIPVTADAEKVMHERGILVVPDFIANAGGVIAAAVEYHGGTEKASFDTIAEKSRPTCIASSMGPRRTHHAAGGRHGARQGASQAGDELRALARLADRLAHDRASRTLRRIHAGSTGARPSSFAMRSRMTNFCTLPVTVMGKSCTNLM